MRAASLLATEGQGEQAPGGGRVRARHVPGGGAVGRGRRGARARAAQAVVHYPAAAAHHRCGQQRVERRGGGGTGAVAHHVRVPGVPAAAAHQRRLRVQRGAQDPPELCQGGVDPAGRGPSARHRVRRGTHVVE
eukprot:4433991-Pyramimonas_sp.AAC.3